jgi:hypothetical protein
MFTCAQMGSKQAYLVSIINIKLCFSYETLVCINNDGDFYETSTYYSSTTSRHISAFRSKLTTHFTKHHKVDNIEMLVNQLLFESTKKIVVESITE